MQAELGRRVGVAAPNLAAMGSGTRAVSPKMGNRLTNHLPGSDGAELAVANRVRATKNAMDTLDSKIHTDDSQCRARNKASTSAEYAFSGYSYIEH